MEDPSESQEDDHESDSGRTDPEEHPNPLFAAHVNYFYRLTLPLKSAARKASSKKKNKVLDGPASTLAKHCVCEQPYSPSIDIMRYCTSCQKWYHHECATPSTGHPEYPFKAPVDAPDELLQIARMPIVRGGVWGVGGNINIVYNARELLRAACENDTNLDNWEEDLTLNGLEEWREWIKYMEKKKKNGEPIWETEAKVFYQCPVCDYSI